MGKRQNFEDFSQKNRFFQILGRILRLILKTPVIITHKSVTKILENFMTHQSQFESELRLE